jgi:hypothetical protein
MDGDARIEKDRGGRLATETRNHREKMDLRKNNSSNDCGYFEEFPLLFPPCLRASVANPVFLA